MNLSYFKQEDLVRKCISEYENSNFPSAGAIALNYSLNSRRVQRRRRGNTSKSTRISINTRLSRA